MSADAARPFRMRHAAHLLRRGAVIAYPTEAVYGLGCDPLDRTAVERLFAIKRRRADKGLILIASRFEQLAPLLQPPDPAIAARLAATWPGPVTWLIPAAPTTPAWLTGGRPKLAVRVTAHPLAAALCEAFGGPLVSTSANSSGRPAARSALQAMLRCPGVDLVLHGALGGRDRPSEIRDAQSGATLRAG